MQRWELFRPSSCRSRLFCDSHAYRDIHPQHYANHYRNGYIWCYHTNTNEGSRGDDHFNACARGNRYTHFRPWERHANAYTDTYSR